MSRAKISVIGAGQVGATTAQRLMERELGDVLLVDIVEGLPQGKALDLAEASPLEAWDVQISGTNDYADIAGSDLVVMTAGSPRKPGMTRMDLLNINAGIVHEAAEAIRKHCPKALVIVVTNPLDVMVGVMHETTGMDKTRVIGMAGALDSARMRYFVADAAGVSVRDVDAMVLGGHGDSMVPLMRYTTINGIRVSELLSQDQIEAIVERTRTGGAEIVGLLKHGSAFYAPGSAVASMVESIVRNQHRVIASSVLLEGEYGIQGAFCGVPVALGRDGIERIIELELTEDELAALRRSADDVKQGMQTLREGATHSG